MGIKKQLAELENRLKRSSKKEEKKPELEGISFGGWRDGPYLCAYEKCERELPLNEPLVMRKDTNQVFCCRDHAYKGRNLKRKASRYSRQDMSADDLLGFAKQFVNLGSSVQEQLVDLMEGRDDDINPNAVKLMKQKLSGYHEEIDDVIERALRRSEEDEQV